MKLYLIIIFTAVSFSVFAQTPGGEIKRDGKHYNPVQAYYDSDKDSIFSVGPQKPLPTIDNLSSGSYGSTLITTTTAYSGNYFAIQVLSDAVIDTLTDAGRDGDGISGLELTAGTIIFGKNITRIKLTSGSVIAYKKGS